MSITRVINSQDTTSYNRLLHESYESNNLYLETKSKYSPANTVVNVNQSKNVHSSLQWSLRIGAPRSRTKLLAQDR